jgi:hypothetical protein
MLLTTTLLTLGLHAAPAQAQSTRTFVSSFGNDVNVCSRPAPCRTLAGAITKTNAGGEINMLDPAGYGAVTIDKAISIVNDGVGSAGILVPAGATGITINAGPTDKINLRGLIIEGGGVGQTGILFNTGKSLTIQNCVIRNLTASGIGFAPNDTSNLAVSNTLVADNGGDGIYVQPSGSSNGVWAVLSRVEIYNNALRGIGAFGNITAGDFAVHVLRSVVGGNGIGIRAEGFNFGVNALVVIGESMITGNDVSFNMGAGGAVYSYGDNYMQGNFSGNASPITIPKS